MSQNFNDYSKMKVGGVKNKSFNKIKNLKGIQINNGVVELTLNNSLIIEKDIKNNDRYNANFTNYIFNYFKLLNRNVFPTIGKKAYKPINELIRIIDLVNNTGVIKYDKGIYIQRMTEYITDAKNNFWTRLKKGDITLVDDLKKSSGSNKNGARSLSSKICKYFSELFYKKSSFYISDSVVRHVLPFYLNFYKIKSTHSNQKDFNNLSYIDLFNYLEKLREIATNNTIGRSELDHIMWYCYKK